MVENNPPASAGNTRPPVIPLPIALYVSGELIFKLYEGRQPCHRFSICWKRFVPGKQTKPEAAPESFPTGLRTHQD